MAERRAWRAPFHRLDVVDSTNAWLRAAALDGAAPWTAVMARRQTRGRGRRGRSWSSPPGGLYLSVLLDQISPEARGVVPLLAGVAVVRALDTWGVETRLKWPNDVRAGGRKIAGILVESLAARNALVIGIGVNVNDGEQQDRPEGAATVSMAELLSRDLIIEDVALEVLAQVALCYDALIASGPEMVVAEWRRRAEDWWGELVSVVEDGRAQHVRLVDVSRSGALLIEASDGTIRELLAGDVNELRLSGGKG